jgi:predicted nucleic-acid-binding Zn-ribbon protein
MTAKNINDKCPKCSSDMIEHPSLLSMPLTSLFQSTSADTKNMSIEDQDANFMFRFSSCKRCGYSEFYLCNGNRRVWGQDSDSKPYKYMTKLLYVLRKLWINK